VPRAVDFDAMMLRHPGERGVCIDHSAAVVVDGDEFSVLAIPGHPGSVGTVDGGGSGGDGGGSGGGVFLSDRSGVPGVWFKDVIDGKLITTLAPKEGALSLLIGDVPPGGRVVTEDAGVDAVRALNPAPTEL
jgi:dipeptidase E